MTLQKYRWKRLQYELKNTDGDNVVVKKKGKVLKCQLLSVFKRRKQKEKDNDASPKVSFEKCNVV